MFQYLQQFSRLLTVLVLVSLLFLTLPPELVAQTNVVTRTEIHDELVAASQTRRQNLERVQRFFSTEIAQSGLKSAGLSPSRVSTAVATLSDAELAQLAARADRYEQDFAAGRFTERDLLLLLLGVAVVILIIVAVR